MQATSSSSHPLRQQLPEILLTLGILIGAGLLLAAYAGVAVDTQRQPFLGLLLHRDLTISDNQSLTGADWPALDAGLVPGDRIVSVDQVDFARLPIDERLEALEEVLDRHSGGDSVTVGFYRNNATSRETPMGAACALVRDEVGLRACSIDLRLRTLPSSDLLAYFGIGWISALVIWLAAVALFLRRVSNTQVRYTVVIASTMAIFLAGHFDTLSSHRLVWGWIIASSLLSGIVALLGVEFPYRFAFIQSMPIWRAAPLLAAIAISGAGISLYESGDPNLSRGAFVLVGGVLIIALLILFATMTWRRTRSSSPIVRNQSTMILIGIIPTLLTVLIWFASLMIESGVLAGLAVFNQVLPILFPLSAMYAVAQFRLVDTDRIITQSMLYTVLLGFVMVGYWLIVTAVAVSIGRSLRETALSPVMIVLSVFVVAFLFTPLRLALQRMIDSLYFRTRRAYRVYLEDFTREVTHAVNLNDVNSMIQHALDETVAPTHIILFVRESSTHDYRPVPDPDTGQRTTDVIFAPDSGLAHYLYERANLLHLEEGSPLPLGVESDRGRLAVLGAPVIVGLRGQKTLNGFIVIGPRQNGDPYLHEDLRFIQNLGDQVSLAVERAQAVDDLERRVRVQDVLSQVSRALNFAIDFDVLLELIYAQTTRVINAPNFYIALRDSNTDELTYVFYNEGDERVESMEGRRWRMGRDLMSEVIRTQQTLRTDDFVRETLSRDPRIHIDNFNLKAWMGVPLLADTGGGALGVMVAATTDPGTAFNDEQLELFWDIANLASSAIDKLQLFEKTQQRARQLGAINEIASQLASEMGNVDRLLQLITENAVQILGTEAGSLLLVDDETGDLEFHVVVGGSGQDLIGRRLPAGSGLVGATVQRGQSMIVNDPARDARWIGNLPEDEDPQPSSGNGHDLEVDDFQTRGLLSVPLLVQNRVIGVLQMVNKRDGSIFVQEDADLLETFAGQAAIAIENARLFDMTDQQLALRVQELDTMQRIDQELNRTLNLNNVVDITMDWALRKSGATAGALFIVEREQNEIILVASYGYPQDGPFGMDGTEQKIYPADKGVVGRVIRTAQPSLITDVSIDPDYDETLQGCVAQLIVPLFSANHVIGVIILESNVEGELDLLDLDFVARLAEHASPAIVNAQLFQALERANQDKSKFVSFVAHDLKNPMTSMKGYTDLLLKGVVGPVNEQQSGFLSTILNNVNRMETLVSDLNDLTQQETGNLRLELFPVNFRNVVVETLRAQQQLIEDKSQEIDLRVPENMPLVMGDQNRLIQIMTNFVSNAYKYTPSGGTIIISAEPTRNLWDPQGPPEVIHCFVKDTGIGMSEEELGKLFMPYFRTLSAKEMAPGTGLGLTITKGLIEQHGGHIWVESETNVGTTFHFTIPIAVEEAAEEGRARV